MNVLDRMIYEFKFRFYMLSFKLVRKKVMAEISLEHMDKAIGFARITSSAKQKLNKVTKC